MRAALMAFAKAAKMAERWGIPWAVLLVVSRAVDSVEKWAVLWAAQSVAAWVAYSVGD